MRLLSLDLRNYRNYRRLELEPGPGLNLFLGRNGQGKTNLLESIAILALSSSPRARRDAELVGPVVPEARIGAVVGDATGESRRTEILVTYREDGGRTRRRIEVDGAARRPVDLPGRLRVSLFWPDDLDLVKAGPEHRRRLLNQLLVQVVGGYAQQLSRYQRAVEQRNALLKQVYAGSAPASELEVWDLELVATAAPLVEARRAAVVEVAAAAAAHHASIGAGEHLALEYAGPPDDLASALAAARREDIRRGVTTQGPHRDDVRIELGGREARSYASQGQQRTAVVAIKLAEADVIAARTGQPPVLLLDDVLSELDGPRRAALLERVVTGSQVVITSAEPGPFPDRILREASVRCIEAGVVTDCG